MNKVCAEKIIYGKLPNDCLKRGCDGSVNKGKGFCCFFPMSEGLEKTVNFAKTYELLLSLGRNKEPMQRRAFC
jgi:hypothetical protein